MVTKEYYDIIDFAELIQKTKKSLYFQLNGDKEGQPCLASILDSSFGLIVGIPYNNTPVLNVYDYDEIDQYELGEKLDRYFVSLAKSHGIEYDRSNIRLRSLR